MRDRFCPASGKEEYAKRAEELPHPENTTSPGLRLVPVERASSDVPA
jgi:hypothetical protein